MGHGSIHNRAVRYRLAIAFAGFGLATLAFASSIFWTNGTRIALLVAPIGLLSVSCGVGALGALAWGLVVEATDVGSYRSRGATAGVLTGVFAPVAAVFASLVAVGVFGRAAPGGLYFLGLAVNPFTGGLVLLFLVVFGVPFGLGTGLVLAEVLDDGSAAGRDE